MATGVMLGAVSLMGADARQRLTFDGDWQFKLCADSADVIHTLQSFGIKENPLKLNGKIGKTTVTDDTEPEQAQVTASEVVTATSENHIFMRRHTSAQCRCLMIGV